MARATYVLRDGELVEKHLAAPLHASSSAPYVRPDGMDAMRSMADGQLYDSRSRYEASLKARGLEIVGNDRKALDVRPDPIGPSVRQDMRRAIEQLSSGGRRGR